MLELNNIRAGYGKRQILNGVSLTVPKGRLVTVIGPNGSGKSTLFKSAAGIIPTLSGEVLIDGTKAADLSRSGTAKKIAYLAQGKSVPDMTVFQLVLHGRFPHLSYPRRHLGVDYNHQRERIKGSRLPRLKKPGLQSERKAPFPPFRAVCGRTPISLWRLHRIPIIFCLTSLRPTLIFHIS